MVTSDVDQAVRILVECYEERCAHEAPAEGQR